MVLKLCFDDLVYFGFKLGFGGFYFSGDCTLNAEENMCFFFFSSVFFPKCFSIRQQ